MILCICPTATVERNWITPNFSVGGFYRVQQEHIFASGKGINVARVIKRLKGRVCGAGFVGGIYGQLFLKLLEKEGITGYWTAHSGETRLSITIIDPEKSVDATSLCHFGPTITSEEWRTFVTGIIDLAKTSAIMSISGSIPPGINREQFYELVKVLVGMKKKVWLDVSGPMLSAGLKANPFGIKVNAKEISELLDCSVKTPDEALQASREIHRGDEVPVVIITLGPDGAVCSGVFGDWRIHPVEYPQIVSSIGSGDAFLGGLLRYDDFGVPFDACLKAACAASCANTQSLGPGFFELDDFYSAMQRVRVERVA